MTELVLDTWGIVAWLQNEEPAANRVLLLLEAASRQECRLVMNIVNLGEVFYVSARLRNTAYAEKLVDELRSCIAIISATDDLVMYAATLKARYRISYADAFAAATAMLRDAPLVTGDPELKAMSANEKTLQLEWIGA